MKTYKIIIAYDGTDYNGWQRQPDKPSIETILEDRFRDIFKKKINIIGASRTDAGVHALGQVAKFNTDINADPQKIKWAWNNLLPKDILIRSLEEVNKEFYPRNNVFEKTYFYHFFLKKPLPIFSRYGWFYKEDIDLEKLNNALKIFIGTHDFRSFCTGLDQENTIRTINSINLRYISRFKVYRIDIKGPKFIRYMIRRIVGASILIASYKNRSIEELKIALEEKNPEQNLFTAPASGLMLYKIHYKKF